MAMPRLLPIVFVAVGGVLALKALTSLEVMPDIFSQATAFAADAVKKDEPKKPAKGEAKSEASKGDDPTESYSIASSLLTAEQAGSDAAAAVPAAPVCATSVNQLAAEAGMSPNELQILSSLGQRRKQLDEREAALNAREQLINTADAKLDNRIGQLTDLKGQIQGLLDQATKVADDDANRLVAVYSAMKPKDAAAVFATMDDDVRLPIAAKMKDRALAAILGAMPPLAARELTEKLSRRMSQAGGLQQKLDKATANGPAATAPAAAAPQQAAKPAATPEKKG
ncbi:hypothetical protein ABI_26050 [Asticcacaulis biprosthecium C19]|uniref:Magnesium transporter MgtE intracellular domain-containing protein n=1 Tax=Asticcacaulis biprosthecium C19 TaxID=715226 RepID=F4QPD2_9CAUL|nr:hypothetical protein [Asticcacaulis biprosthecium]EGF91190.1 hypothetical protein ABI_26050 [Asticcacaulis biprosthecium C19]